ncbi:MAG TPA: alpha-amylase family glycosyl hydrolase [Noviherbaspirillum sp.]|nr:alpha-amylase family glycosyl hydrolase [Noviherbaspirillum sp.]
MSRINPSDNSGRAWQQPAPAEAAGLENRPPKQEQPSWGTVVPTTGGGRLRSKLLGIATGDIRQPGTAGRSDIDPVALSNFIVTQPWFVQNKPVASVEVMTERRLATTEDGDKFFLFGVNVRFADGTKERWVAPARVDSHGGISDALSSDAFKNATLAVAAAGGHLEPGMDATLRRFRQEASDAAGPRLRALRDKRVLKRLVGRMPRNGAQGLMARRHAELRRAICKDNGSQGEWSGISAYTTRERYLHVLEQAKILSPDNADTIVVDFFRKVQDTVDAQPREIRDFYKGLATRPRFEPVFYGYAQHIAVPEGKTDGTFEDLADALASIEELGFHALEIMPHYESPMMDSGYDISDHRSVRESLGGNEAYASFMNEAIGRGMRVAIDLVVNHVSHEHSWVKAVAEGDESMLSRFVNWDDAVKIGERDIKGDKFNVFLHMRGEHAGKLTHAFQCFPDNNPDTMVELGPAGARHKLYITFMSPYQFDVNTAHPEVASYLLDTIATFSTYGNSDLRVDAPVHTWKQPGTYSYNLPQTRALASLVKAFASHVTGGANTVLSEVFMPWERSHLDWLEPEKNFDGRIENTISDALIGFSLHEAILHTLLSAGKSYWVKAQRELGVLPDHKSVLAYLGLHDENFVTEPALVEELEARGATKFSARIGDSSAELLQHDPRRLAMAYALLYGSKGHPAVYYRGIVGAPNNTEFFEQKRAERFADMAPQRPLTQDEEEMLLLKAADARDLDRGPNAKGIYKRKLEEAYLPLLTIQALNTLWEEHGAMRTNDIEEIANSDIGILSMARRATDSNDPPLLQLINLTDKDKVVHLDLDDLERQLGWSELKKFVDVLRSTIDKSDSEVPFHVDGRTLRIQLRPYDAFFLESRNP